MTKVITPPTFDFGTSKYQPAGDYVPGSPDNPNASDLASGFNKDTWEEYARKKADEGDEAWLEKLWNYYASEASLKTARDFTAEREDNAYTRMIGDLRRAGISPYILSGASPVVSGSSSKSYSGTELTSRSNNRDTNARSKQTETLQTILHLLGVMITAAAIAAA